MTLPSPARRRCTCSLQRDNRRRLRGRSSRANRRKPCERGPRRRSARRGGRHQGRSAWRGQRSLPGDDGRGCASSWPAPGARRGARRRHDHRQWFARRSRHCGPARPRGVRACAAIWPPMRRACCRWRRHYSAYRASGSCAIPRVADSLRVVHEIVRASGLEARLHEPAIPIRAPVRSVCETLGYDPLYLACEGRIVAVVAPEHAGTRAQGDAGAACGVRRCDRRPVVRRRHASGAADRTRWRTLPRGARGRSPAPHLLTTLQRISATARTAAQCRCRCCTRRAGRRAAKSCRRKAA